MNNEIEKLEVKKILDNLEYVSDIHKVFIEDGYKIQEEIPSSQIKELRLNSYSAKLLFNHINNLQSKIDKANELIKRKLSTETYQHLKKLYDDIDSNEEIWEDYEFEDLLDILKEVE